MSYDVLVVGAGLYGAVRERDLTDRDQLVEYKYFDMDQVISAALNKAEDAPL